MFQGKPKIYILAVFMQIKLWIIKKLSLFLQKLRQKVKILLKQEKMFLIAKNFVKNLDNLLQMLIPILKKT